MASENTEKEFGQCRCCLKDGYHKDIMKEYRKNGIRETYYNMISDCFNLFLSTTLGVPMMICSGCVEQLRQATCFRTLIVESEQKLLRALGNKDTVFINVPEPLMQDELNIKVEIYEVKDESAKQDDSHCYDEEDFRPADDDNKADERVVPTERGDLVEGEAALLARFRRARVSALPTRRTLRLAYPLFAKHLDLLSNTRVTSRMVERLYKEDELQNDFWDRVEKTTSSYLSEKAAHMVNAFTLLENSNLIPFKSRHRQGFPCFFCRKAFENLHKLKEHQKKLHKKNDLKTILRTLAAESFVVYADVTDLKCTICDKSIPSMNDLKSHLVTVHKKMYYQEHTDRIIPFKLSDTNTYECQICGFYFETFGAIERHMNTHYRNYACRECGNGFITKYRLKVHIKSTHTEGALFPCEDCKKVFQTHQKLRNHIDTVHKMIKRFKCAKCPERFTEYFKRQKHMVAEHGMAPLEYICKVCDKTFDRRYTLSRHVRRDHLEVRDFQCEVCSYKCFTKNELLTHMIKHNGKRIHECSVCKKSYARKKTLTEHMRIHNNDRRFSCDVCGQAFVQKCSLKGHLKTHHAEYSVQMESRLKSEFSANQRHL